MQQNCYNCDCRDVSLHPYMDESIPICTIQQKVLSMTVYVYIPRDRVRERNKKIHQGTHHHHHSIIQITDTHHSRQSPIVFFQKQYKNRLIEFVFVYVCVCVCVNCTKRKQQKKIEILKNMISNKNTYLLDAKLIQPQ